MSDGPATQLGYCPYASPANVQSVLRRIRSRTVPEEIDQRFIQGAGVPAAAAARTLRAVRYLGLLDEVGGPTPSLQALARASSDDYRKALAAILRNRYASVFATHDPGMNPQAELIDAFSGFDPASQHNRMMVLFLGLCREAGIPVLEEPKPRRSRSERHRRELTKTSKGRDEAERAGPDGGLRTVAVHPALAALLEMLPDPGVGWDARERWLEAFRAALELVLEEPDD